MRRPSPEFGIHAGNGAVKPGTHRLVTFNNGQQTLELGQKDYLSDPFSLRVDFGDALTVTIFLKGLHAGTITGHLETNPYAYLAPASTPDVRRGIAELLREGEPDIERLSRQLGIASRTLQKRLSLAGSSFRDETRFVRQRLTASYLQDPRLQIVDIALLLGYSEHSAFTRAFREWTGKSPSQLRGGASQG